MNLSKHFPIGGHEIVLLEAKHTLNPELIGQAVVYQQLALRAGATVRDIITFSKRADDAMLEVTKTLGVSTVVLSATSA